MTPKHTHRYQTAGEWSGSDLTRGEPDLAKLAGISGQAPATPAAGYATILSQLCLLHGSYEGSQTEWDAAFRSDN